MKRSTWFQSGPRRRSAAGPSRLSVGSSSAGRHFSELNVRSHDELNLFLTPFTFFDAKLIWLSHSQTITNALPVASRSIWPHTFARCAGSVIVDALFIAAL